VIAYKGSVGIIGWGILGGGHAIDALVDALMVNPTSLPIIVIPIIVIVIIIIVAIGRGVLGQGGPFPHFVLQPSSASASASINPWLCFGSTPLPSLHWGFLLSWPGWPRTSQRNRWLCIASLTAETVIEVAW
jgi:hypothetical protein